MLCVTYFLILKWVIIMLFVVVVVDILKCFFTASCFLPGAKIVCLFSLQEVHALTDKTNMPGRGAKARKTDVDSETEVCRHNWPWCQPLALPRLRPSFKNYLFVVAYSLLFIYFLVTRGIWTYQIYLGREKCFFNEIKWPIKVFG